MEYKTYTVSITSYPETYEVTAVSPEVAEKVAREKHSESVKKSVWEVEVEEA